MSRWCRRRRSTSNSAPGVAPATAATVCLRNTGLRSPTISPTGRSIPEYAPRRLPSRSIASRSSIWQGMSLRYDGIAAVTVPASLHNQAGQPAAMPVKIASALPGLRATSAAWRACQTRNSSVRSVGATGTVWLQTR
jgi:hypothetical protein